MSIWNEPRSKMGLPPHGLKGWMLACQIPLPPPAPRALMVPNIWEAGGELPSGSDACLFKK